MKSRTSFCNTTVLKKDLTRYLPLWSIYLIGALLIASGLLDSDNGSVARAVHKVFQFMPVITCGYALVVALFLFGDLYNSRLCNALHAMPLRRESWFCTHFISGILMSLVPNLVITLALIPLLDSYWYIALLWLGGSTLMYLFFFGLAAFCALTTGNRFATIVVYGLANTFSLIIYWLLSELILSQLYGVQLNVDVLYYLCPLYPMIESDYWYWTYPNSGSSVGIIGLVYDRTDYPYPSAQFCFDSGWGYLFILAAIGIGLAVAALMLYRKRKLECAGDFAAVKPVRWVVAISGSLACGMVFRLFGLNNSALKYMLLFLGIIIGFFLLQMLLQRKVKVFNKPTVVKCLCLVLIFAVILVCGVLDVFGFETYIPKEDSIRCVLVANTYLDSLDISDMAEEDHPYLNYAQVVKLTAEKDIARIRKYHQEILDQRPNSGRPVTIAYVLNNGSVVTRVYYLDRDSSLYLSLESYWNGDTYSYFGVDDVDDIVDNLIYCCVECEQIPDDQAATLIKYLWLDVREGLVPNNTDGGYIVDLEYYLSNGSANYASYVAYPGSYSYKYITGAMQNELSRPDNLFGMRYEDAIQRIVSYSDDEEYITDKDQIQKLVDVLWADGMNGTLAQYQFYHQADDKYYYDYVSISITFSNGEGRDGYTTHQLTIWSDCEETWQFLHGNS